MNSLYRWTASSSFAAAVLMVATACPAFTDSNAEAKEAALDRLPRVVVVAKAAPPAQTAWVPTSAKKLDGFKPVLPPERGRREVQTVAKADAR